MSFEREVFPRLVGEGLYGFHADGYWVDIGTPERYLEATYDLLAGRVDSALPPRDETGSLVGEGCLTSGAHIGPQTVLGGHCSVGSDSTVERSVLHDRVIVGADCVIRDAILAARRARGRRRARGAGRHRGQRRADRGRGRDRARRQGPAGRGRRGPRGVSDPMLDDVLAQPHQLGDALWRVEAAKVPAREAPGGLLVCGMGGSAIGADLAAAAIGPRATAPLRVVRGYAPEPWLDSDTLVLCSSYSGNTEETLACFEAAGAAGAPRVALTTGGALAERARAEDVPVIGVPSRLPAARGRRLHDGRRAGLRGGCRRRARPALGGRGRGRGARGAGRRSRARRARGVACATRFPWSTAPSSPRRPAARWKGQLNENAKVAAFLQRAAGGQPQRDRGLELGRRARAAARPSS